MKWQQEERQHHDTPWDSDGEGETNRAKEPDPYKPPREDRNEEILGRNNRGNGPPLYQPKIGERSWEPHLWDIHKELSWVRETVKERAPVSMEKLVKQTKSPFTTEVLHFPLPAKFRMP